MQNLNLELGIIGLGKMGSNLALQCLDKNIKVIGKTLHPDPELAKKGIQIVTNYHEFRDLLKQPRAIYLSLPAGHTIDHVLSDLLEVLSPGDVIMDGGNSFYLDSIRREQQADQKHVYFLDTGTSGGIDGARNGACFMVGGKVEGINVAKPILTQLAVEGGFVHTGEPGSGHFVKLVHNGIEFGMLQAIGEGVTLMTKGQFQLDLPAIFENWRHGSVIRGWLIDLMASGLHNTKLSNVESYIEDTGEVNWLAMEAIKNEIPIPVITQSVIELFKSREKSSDTYRAIALMRHGFGGHPFGADAYIQNERKTSRVEQI